MTGVGLENVKQYAWVKQPNGRFTIFRVPIFSTFQDERHGTVEMKDLAAVVHNFQNDKLERFRYPRVHIGHHEGNENRPGAGYLDNLRVDGNDVVADLVEITADVFQDMRNNLKYPYVSAEYNPNSQQILSLALLESQPPFFKFPLLKLQDTPLEITKFQNAERAAWACRFQILQFQENFQQQFQEGCPCMEDEKKTDNTNSPSTGKEAMIDQEPMKYKCQLEEAGLGAKLDRLLSLTEKIYAWEQSEHEMGDEMGEEMPEEAGMESMPGEELPPEEPQEFSAATPSKPMQPKENPMKKPSSVAFQAAPDLVACMQEMSRAVRSVAQRQEKVESQINFSLSETRLRKLCDERGLNFQEHSDVLRKFSSNKDREVYLEMLGKTSWPKHPAAMVGYAPVVTQAQADNILQKFQDVPDFQKKIAHDASQVYMDTVNQPDTRRVKKFQQFWPTMDKFVSYVVQESYSDPEILKKMTL